MPPRGEAPVNLEVRNTVLPETFRTEAAARATAIIAQQRLAVQAHGAQTCEYSFRHGHAARGSRCR